MQKDAHTVRLTCQGKQSSRPASHYSTGLDSTPLHGLAGGSEPLIFQIGHSRLAKLYEMTNMGVFGRIYGSEGRFKETRNGDVPSHQTLLTCLGLFLLGSKRLLTSIRR